MMISCGKTTVTPLHCKFSVSPTSEINGTQKDEEKGNDSTAEKFQFENLPAAAATMDALICA
jgi:hypothetical protein